MGLKGFERRLERLVEGVFARAARSGLAPVELGRRLAREMDDQRTVSVRGEAVVPNNFTFTLSPSDHAQYTDMEDALARELVDAARSHAADEGYSFMGPVEVALAVDPGRSTGSFELHARFKEAPGGGRGAALVLADGGRVILGSVPVRIGRSPDSDVVLADPNVSRRHAEIRPEMGGYVVRDLGSTNGTRVNGSVVSERRLADGDEIGVGAARLRFEAS
jgi:hypothetical protein